MAETDIASEWKSFDEAKRTRLLSKMSPEQKKKLRGVIEAKPSGAGGGWEPAPGTSERLTAGYDPSAAEFGEKHPIAGPPTRFFSSVGGTVMGLPSFLYHSITDPLSEEEKKDFEGRTRIPGEVTAERLLGARQIVEAGKDYANPETRKQILKAAPSLVPEALGAGTGAYVGGELAGRGLAELKSKLPAPKAEATRQFAQRLTGTGKEAVEEQVRAKAKAADVKASRVAEQNAKIAEQNATAKAQAQAPVLEQKAHTEAMARRGVSGKELADASSKLQAQVETARVKALKVGNEKYSAVNEKLSPIAGDAEKLTSALHDSLSRISGTETQPTILKSISDRLLGAEEEGTGGISYSDLQGYYSELGRELSKGTLPGDVYSAYDVMHDAIGEQMQEIADSQGAGEQLHDARAYWKRMKQTFGRPPSATDVASTTLKEVAPEYIEQQTRANRLRNLGYFDPEIPRTAEAIDHLRESLKGPVPKEPMGPTVPTVKPLKAVETPEVNTKQVREQLLRKWVASGEKISVWRMSFMLSGGLSSLFTTLYGKPELAMAELGAGIAYGVGPSMVAKLAERPAIREWLTRPPSDELQALRQLPHADKIRVVDTLNKIVQQSQKTAKPIKVSPKLSTILGMASAAGQPAPRRHPSDEFTDPNHMNKHLPPQ